MASRGLSPSIMLRQIMGQFGSTAPDRQTLVRYFSEAFCFTEGQAHPIFGWFPDGTGRLKDTDLDHVLGKRIEQTRGAWELAS